MNYISCKFSDELLGLNTFVVVFHTTLNNQTMYDYYNEFMFKTPENWDHFWFNTDLNTLLFYAKDIVIGKTENEISRIKVNPENIIRKDQKAKVSVLGIPIITEDLSNSIAKYYRTKNLNEDNREPVKVGSFNSSDYYIPFDFDFTERVYTVNYFGYLDIISAIGGLNSSANLFMGFLMPLFMFIFLYSLAMVVKERYSKEYKAATIDFIKYMHE